MSKGFGNNFNKKNNNLNKKFLVEDVESINLNIDKHTKEMMENSFKKRALKVDILDIKLSQTNKS